MPGWASTENLLKEEEKQLIEEGAVPDAARAAVAEARRRHAAGANEWDVWSAVEGVPRRADFPFNEPSDLASIKALRAGGVRRFARDWSDDELLDKLYGAWLGRCAGCALGKPVEGFMGEQGGLKSWERQKTYLTAVSPDEWPLRDYFPSGSPAAERTGRNSNWCEPSTREHIAYMETDDDIRYTVIGQIVMQRGGRNFASAHVAHAWFDLLPYHHVCTAETQAYRNMAIAADQFRRGPGEGKGAEIDAATDWHFITHHLNPYREWIGAQIRIDSYGYAAPGNPELAAEFAWRDARISHVKNGIYGAMYCAAMIAAAFATDDPHAIVEAGLAEIPKTSRLHAEMRQVIEICRKHGDDYANFEAVIRDIESLLGHYHPVHTNNNAGLVTAAVLLSRGDFHKGITFAVMGGWDTDCNGATVGSIVGAICGGKRAPKHWVGRLNDTLKSLIIDYHPIAISECAARSLKIVRDVASA